MSAPNIVDDLLRTVSKLPPEGLAILGKIFQAIRGSKDPMRAAKRAAAAAASKEVSEAALKKILNG